MPLTVPAVENMVETMTTNTDATGAMASGKTSEVQ
jgi:hypothetical protein